MPLRVLGLLVAVACAPKSAPVAAPEADRATLTDARPDEPVVATPPAPYTADAIRAAFPSGTSVVIAMTGTSGSVVHEHWTFLDATDTSVRIASIVRTPTGELVEDQGSHTSTWDELAAHAIFPPSDVPTRTRDVVEGALGRFEAWRYDVRRDVPNEPVQQLAFWFADTLPGPPVRMVAKVEGQVVHSFEQIARSVPAVP